MGLDDAFPIWKVLSVGLGFAPGLIGVGFSWQKMCIMVDMIHMIHINESLFYISGGSHMVRPFATIQCM